jgi:hypothetical protein
MSDRVLSESLNQEKNRSKQGLHCLIYGHLYRTRPSADDKENIMGPRISVYRKGDDIFVTIEGDFNNESSQELVWVVRQMLKTSLQCAAPGSQVTYSLKTHSKVDLEKMAQFQQLTNDQPNHHGACEDTNESQEKGSRPVQGTTPNRRSHNGLILVKGGNL